MKITRYRVVEEEANIPHTLNGFKDWKFTTGSTTGEDFKVFSRMFQSRIRKSLPAGARLVKFNSGHYYLSGFIRRDNNFVYFSISDVRFFPNGWHQHILVRTARSDTDYIGDSNHYTSLEEFSGAVDRLLG
jgi:hypothetical protein